MTSVGSPTNITPANMIQSMNLNPKKIEGRNKKKKA